MSNLTFVIQNSLPAHVKETVRGAVYEFGGRPGAMSAQPGEPHTMQVELKSTRIRRFVEVVTASLGDRVAMRPARGKTIAIEQVPAGVGA